MNFIKQYLGTVFGIWTLGMFASLPIMAAFLLISLVFGFTDEMNSKPGDILFVVALWVGTACVGAGFYHSESNTAKGLWEQIEFIASLRRQQEGNIKGLERNNEANKRRSEKLREELKSQTLAWNKTLHRENQIALRQKLALCLDISNLSAEVEDERQQKRLLDDEILERDSREGHN